MPRTSGDRQRSAGGWIAIVLIGLALCPFISSRLHAATPQQISAALDKARDYLHRQQREGHWEMVPEAPADLTKEYSSVSGAQYGGLTALATYALLAAGDSPKDPVVEKGVQFLLQAKMGGVYAIGMRAQVWGYLQQTSDVRAAIGRDGSFLVKAMREKGSSKGLFSYIPGTGDSYDHSVSQFGMLGAWALAQQRYDVPRDFWLKADKAWRTHQLPTGAWCYHNGGPSNHGMETPTMTAAGIATLFITNDFIHASEFAECRGNLPDKNIEAGLKWIGDNFNAVMQLGERTGYGLYGVERIGVASGRKYLGSHNWFVEGADWLVKTQRPDGSWGKGDTEFSGNNFRCVPQTVFGLLFLSRGRAPVMIQKLQYDLVQGEQRTEAPWNQRPRDIANLLRWTGKSLERDLNWQSTTLAAPIDELHDAPILYIAGIKPLSFSKEEKDKLRQYVEEGGVIIAHADCSSDSFGKSFVKLGQELFPYEFRDLPENHPIYTNGQYLPSKWSTKPRVRAMSNGIRELMFLIPTGDLARYWQIHMYVGHEEAFQLMNNIILYATDRQYEYKGETHIVRPDPKITALKTVKIARLIWDANPNANPEPGGWRRMHALMHNQYKTDLDVQNIVPGDGKLRDYRIAHLTGTTKFKLPAKAIDELRAFVDAGGTLIVDAAGGSQEFAVAAQEAIESIWPDARKNLQTPLPPNHAVFRVASTQPARVSYSSWARHNSVGTIQEPRIRAIDIKGRAAVFFSAEDISFGLVGRAMDGVVGYTPESACNVMANVLLHATGGLPTTNPATTTASTKPATTRAAPPKP